MKTDVITLDAGAAGSIEHNAGVAGITPGVSTNDLGRM